MNQWALATAMPRWRQTNFVSSLNIPRLQKVHSISKNALAATPGGIKVA